MVDGWWTKPRFSALWLIVFIVVSSVLNATIEKVTGW